MLRILTYPDPFLRQTAQPVATIDDRLRALAEEMIETMYDANGVGLAAPQVGVGERLVVMDVHPGEDPRPIVLVNPVITAFGKEKGAEEEGCLSVPELRAKVTRPLTVRAEWYDLEGQKVEVEADELLARALQHEIDHLDGVLFVDKVSLAGKLSIRGELKRREAEYEAAHAS